jgi:hypothetical protein
MRHHRDQAGVMMFDDAAISLLSNCQQTDASLMRDGHQYNYPGMLNKQRQRRFSIFRGSSRRLSSARRHTSISSVQKTEFNCIQLCLAVKLTTHLMHIKYILIFINPKINT